MIDIEDLPISEVNEPVYRVILSRYPQIDLFERVSNPEDWDVLYKVESLTNPRLRDEVGDIRLVPPEDRVYGDGASWIMAAFTHPPVDGRGGRFNRDFGIYYCAADEAVAIAESSFHRARFLRESRIEQTTQDMRVLRTQLARFAHRFWQSSIVGDNLSITRRHCHANPLCALTEGEQLMPERVLRACPMLFRAI